MLIDITSLVQTWVASPDANKGVALALTSGSTASFFDAKESLLTANGPELEIALSGTGQQGPPGPKGDKGDPGIQGPMGAAGTQGPKGDTARLGRKDRPGHGTTGALRLSRD